MINAAFRQKISRHHTQSVTCRERADVLSENRHSICDLNGKCKRIQRKFVDRLLVAQASACAVWISTMQNLNHGGRRLGHWDHAIPRA